MSENGDEKQQGRRRGNSTEKELASQQIQIQSKRFYIDVKENQRGRFIKLAEVGVGGRKSRILMTMSAAEEFKKHLIEFSDLHSEMGPTHGSAEGENNDSKKENGKDTDGHIKSETFIKDRKRYYMDLKENQRGRFLRVSMVVAGPRGARTQVAIPAQGLIEFKDQLSDMLERYNTLPEEVKNSEQADLPESKSVRAENKTFYFDYGSNQRGNFLKISEVRQNRYRTSITVPEKFIVQFSEQIKEFADKAALNTSLNEEPSKENTESETETKVVKTEVVQNGLAVKTEKVTASLAATSISAPAPVK
jgi:hypothetical protein